MKGARRAAGLREVRKGYSGNMDVYSKSRGKRLGRGSGSNKVSYECLEELGRKSPETRSSEGA